MKRLWRSVFMVILLTGGVNQTVFGSPSEKEDAQQISAYFFAAARIGEVDVLEQFINAGFPINLRNLESYTALMIAAYNGQSKAVELLIQNGADVCARDKRGNTALMGALIKGELSIAKNLYQQTCSDRPNKAGLTLSEFAKMYGQADTLKGFANKDK
ncbi:ankyrin repeat domain-containing protein [Vibrio sp. TRT 21S02]|uniref:ankyrin repeat domain-containing protein n=1 Tax=Vibrio sp. TRT 21S02 TaxID=3418507 RepID=UPI003CF49C82